MRTWLVVVDGVRGRLFKVDRSAKKLIETKDFLNSEARLHKREFMSDIPGRSFDINGQSCHPMQRNESSKEKSKKQFAHEIVKYLDGQYKVEKINQIIIVAPSKMMGHMSQKLSKTNCRNVVKKIVKEIASFSEDEIFKILKKELLTHKKII